MHMTYEVHIWIYRVSEHVIIKMCWNCLLRLQLTAYFLYFWTDITDVTHDSLWMANFVDWQLTAVAWKMTPKDRAVLLFFVFSHSATHLNTSPLLLILKQEAHRSLCLSTSLTWLDLGARAQGRGGSCLLSCLPPSDSVHVTSTGTTARGKQGCSSPFGTGLLSWCSLATLWALSVDVAAEPTRPRPDCFGLSLWTVSIWDNFNYSDTTLKTTQSVSHNMLTVITQKQSVNKKKTQQHYVSRQPETVAPRSKNSAEMRNWQLFLNRNSACECASILHNSLPNVSKSQTIMCRGCGRIKWLKLLFIWSNGSFLVSVWS